ncbi:glucosaminidase domain-containing protein [Holdemania filiformis]|uniref:glucosaminidase domain-containing protein n=1 Tax=Holdemania filiformis TaxID=61171 RepID=UPI00210DCF08|nr:glucosaminidase domain-containing protein [Holdemania filiformis]MCQ4954120.1 glucosaminidase domain-containing protein [Holdemania filiformis]
MKQIWKMALALAMAVTLVQGYPSANGKIDVKADETYPMGCGNFEVAYVTDNGGFSTIGCYNDFTQAKNEMYAHGNDAVVRHSSSKSPTKIIAMTSGVAASYSYRRGYADGSSRRAYATMDITQYQSTTTNEKITYVTSHREMIYKGTYSYNTGNGSGRIAVNLTGFDGYTNLDQVDLIPTKFLTNNMRILLGGNNDGSPWESPFWVRPRQSYYEVVQNGNYKELIYHCWSYWAKSDTPQDYSQTIGPAESWMNVGAVYYTNDMHALYTDRYFQNPVMVEGSPAKYYNYYEFLPLRSRTKFNGDQLNGFLNSRGYNEVAYDYDHLQSNQSKMVNSGWFFVNAQETYGVNALLAFCMGLLESGWGRSSIAINKNNLFGWNAVDSNPSGSADKYDNIESAVTQHMAVNLRGYLDINDARFFGSHLGNKGSGFNVKYASDPYWGLKIAALAYQVDKYVSGNNGSLTDYGTYSLGVINQYDAAVKRYADANSQTLYTTRYGATYQNDFTVILQSESNGWTGFPTTNGVRSDGALVPHKGNGYEAYNWQNSVGYLQSSKISKLSAGIFDNSQIGKVPTGDVVQKVAAVAWKDNLIAVNGQAYRPGIYVTDSNKVTQKLVVYNQYYDTKEFELTSTVSEKEQVSFKTEALDFTTLAEGSYFFEICTEYSELSDYNNSFYIGALETLPETKKVGNKTFSFSVKDNVLFMSVKLSGSEEGGDSGDHLKSTVRQALSKFEYADEHTLLIEGTAFINGYDFKEDSEVSHQLLLTNLETNEVTTIEAVTSLAPNPINLYDGFTYSKINFSASVNLAALTPGSYSVKIQIRNGDVKMYANLTSFDSNFLPEMKTLGEYRVQIVQNQLYNYRYEINIEKSDLDYSLINKPTKRNSAFDYTKLSLEGGRLNLNGMAWIYNAQFKAETQASQALIAVDENGVSYPLEAQNQACSVDYAEMLGSKFSMKNACFTSAADLSQLPEGDYRLYLDISAEGYRDIYEMTDIYSRAIETVTVDDRSYALFISPVRYRMVLSITQNGPNTDGGDDKGDTPPANAVQASELPVEDQPVEVPRPSSLVVPTPSATPGGENNEDETPAE